MMSEQTSMVRDSLEEEGERVVNGVIKVNHSLLSQLTTSSPLDVYKPTNTYRYIAAAFLLFYLFVFVVCAACFFKNLNSHLIWSLQ